MSKLIVEMDMPENMEINGIPDCCGLCDPLFTVVCATKHDQTIDKMMLRVGRPSWCPIKGVLPDEHGDLIDRSLLCADLAGVILSHSGLGVGEVIARQNAVIAAERKPNKVEVVYFAAERSEHGTEVD